jgi:branched-subunit amino acid aminotransferase/4-amino-4-deoxychorismate lyase
MASAIKGDAIWMDGELVPWDEARVHVLTHTLHYGLGVFEGIRCYRTADGRSAVFRLEEHVRRLYESSRRCAPTGCTRATSAPWSTSVTGRWA